MYHPTTRVLTVLELLQARGQIGSAELAIRLEVSKRSVRRYITMLGDLGIPIESRPGRHGGYRLRPGFKLPPLMLTNDEALTVALGLQLFSRLGLASAHPATAGAMAKIDRVLPDTVRQGVRAIQDAVVFDEPPSRHRTSTGTLVSLSTAVQQQRKLWIRYRSGDQETTRLIDPYGVVFRDGWWYAVGWCHLRQDVRIFRLDRIMKYRLLSNQFALPESIEPRQLVRETLERQFGTAEVRLLLHTDIEEARRWIPIVMAHLTETTDGVLLTCNTGSLEWMAYFIAGLPWRVEIHHPPALKSHLDQLATRIRDITYRPQVDLAKGV